MITNERLFKLLEMMAGDIARIREMVIDMVDLQEKANKRVTEKLTALEKAIRHRKYVKGEKEIPPHKTALFDVMGTDLRSQGGCRHGIRRDSFCTECDREGIE